MDRLRPESRNALGRERSSSSPSTSASAAAAAGRTSSTARAAELARHRGERGVLEPQAVIHSLNGAGSRSTLRAYPCVVTHRDTWTPIDAILRGGLSSQTPVILSIRGRPEPERGQRVDERLLEVRHVPLDVPSMPAAGRRSGSRRAARARGRSTCRRGRSRRPRPPHRQAGAARRASARRPSVTDGRVLDEDDRVGDRALRDRPGERALELPRLAVGTCARDPSGSPVASPTASVAGPIQAGARSS